MIGRGGAISRPSLHDLGMKCDTDKAFSHAYTRFYDRLFDSQRDDEISLLELGYLGGASARMWSEYFPHAKLYYVDINGPRDVLPPRTWIQQCDQADAAALEKLHNASGDYDIIIDDASHFSSKTIASFQILWPWLRPGGYYLVEDTHSSYHRHYYGVDEAHPDPDKSPNRGVTAMQWFKRMADEANFNPRGTTDLELFPRRFWLGYAIEWILFRYNLIAIKKAE